MDKNKYEKIVEEIVELKLQHPLSEEGKLILLAGTGSRSGEGIRSSDLESVTSCG